MTDALARMRRFLRELRRRKVYRVAAVYLAAAFVVVQLAALAARAFGLPPWFEPMVWVLIGLGFPIALVLAWAYEVTPEGVRRTEPAPGAAAGAADIEREEVPTETRSIRGLLVALGLLAAAAAAGGWYLSAGDDGAAVTDRSVAVLPFETLGTEANPTFTEGLHDGLLTRLANVSDLRVISRTSVLGYRDSRMSVPEIARELGVAWVLEGGVQRVGGEVQVNAQLIDARDDSHAWAKSYRRRLSPGNLFAIQAELTKEIARSLEAELTAGERERVERRPTESLEAYRLYVQGRAHLDRRTEEGMRRGLISFQRAIERDSGYAQAWSGTADARILLASYGHGSADTLLPQALAAVRKALEIDPELAEARASLGLIHQDLWQDGPAAVRELRRAVELRPSYARAHHWLGVTLATLGRFEQSWRALERAVELDPLSPSILTSLAGTHRYGGQPEEALVLARRTEELVPGFSGGPMQVGLALLDLGRADEAIASFRRVLERANPGPGAAARTRASLAVAHLRAGDSLRARKLLRDIERSGSFPFSAALVYAELKEEEAAFDALRRADYGSYSNAIALHYTPWLDPLRDDPRFRKLIRRVNVAWGLEPDGSLPTDAGPSSPREAGPDREHESGGATRG